VTGEGPGVALAQVKRECKRELRECERGVKRRGRKLLSVE
jgi:hypothetical protein